jgi:hypothetical protein
MQDDFYDDPDLAVPDGEWIKWDEPKTLVGTIRSRAKGTDFGGKPCAVYSVETDSGDTVALSAAQYQIKREAAAEKWAVGDRIAINFIREERMDNGNRVKVFEIETKKASDVSAEKPKSLL